MVKFKIMLQVTMSVQLTTENKKGQKRIIFSTHVL